jgi:hypothetical protein
MTRKDDPVAKTKTAAGVGPGSHAWRMIRACREMLVNVGECWCFGGEGVSTTRYPAIVRPPETLNTWPVM